MENTTVNSMEDLLVGKPTVVVRVRVTPKMKDRLIQEAKNLGSDESKITRIALAKHLTTSK